jgi:hypothetical protein
VKEGIFGIFLDLVNLGCIDEDEEHNKMMNNTQFKCLLFCVKTCLLFKIYYVILKKLVMTCMIKLSI